MILNSDSLRGSIAALARQNKIISLIQTLFIPTIIGILSGFYRELTGLHWTVFWLPIALLAIAAIILAKVNYDVRLAPEVYVEMVDAENEIDSLQKTTRFLSTLQEQALALSSMVREHIKKTPSRGNNLKEAINEIGSLLVANQDELFDFQHKELWSFAVYIYSKEEDSLYPIWRSKHRKHPSKTDGRIWRPGQGHVGIAWSQREGKICPDISVAGIADMFSPSTLRTAYDAVAYASFVSEPIGPYGEDAHPYGVLVATSNIPDRFDIASSLPLRHAATAIASLIYLAYDQASLEDLTKTAKPPTPERAISAS